MVLKRNYLVHFIFAVVEITCEEHVSYKVIFFHYVKEVDWAFYPLSLGYINVFISPLGSEEEFGGLVSANLILLRNRLLDILLKLVHTSKEKTSINLQ